jgi:YVTN family beta-propeller protein
MKLVAATLVTALVSVALAVAAPAAAGGLGSAMNMPGMDAPSIASSGSSAGPPAPPPPAAVNIYSQIGASHLGWAVVAALPRVYVPNHSANTVSVIDPSTLKVVDTFKVGAGPQHVIPSWDLSTLWVANNGRGSRHGSLTPIDPRTGKPGAPVDVPDPYNMYFMPDGSAAIVVDEALRRLDLRDPRTMALKAQIATPTCHGINHADFSADGAYAIFTCEFNSALIKVDLRNRQVLGTLTLPKMSMPQDIRLSPDGRAFYVADMAADGVHVIDAASFTIAGFIPTGPGAHGLTVSRDGTKLYVSTAARTACIARAGTAREASA